MILRSISSARFRCWRWNKMASAISSDSVETREVSIGAKQALLQYWAALSGVSGVGSEDLSYTVAEASFSLWLYLQGHDARRLQWVVVSAASSSKFTCYNYPALFVTALLICVLDLLIWFILLWSFYYADPWHSFWHYRNVLCSLCCRQLLCSICRHSAVSFCAAFADIVQTAFVQHLQTYCR